jgi:hypothetical protein
MFSRLTALAALFAVVTTASFAYATNVQQRHHAAAKASAQVIVLERVVVTGKRVPDASN